MGNGSDETSGLFLLLQSLTKLNRHHACLQAAVEAFLLLLQADGYEGTDLWTVAIKEVVTIIDCCLTEGKDDLQTACEAGIFKRLGTCLLKAMDIACNLSQLHSMPTCLLWKVFYALISK